LLFQANRGGFLGLMPRDGSLTLSDIREPTLSIAASGAAGTGATMSNGSSPRTAPTPS
jgi:hypothetical protein